MGTELARTDTAAVMERVLMVGDLSKLSAAERVSYYLTTCESLGLNPATRPFDYITLQGKMQLYARRDAADQLRRRDKISITITAREKVDDVYVVTARATTPDDRTDEAIGAVPLAGLRGEALANAFMKAETKSKRRVTLSICGLGFTDESEVDSIPGAQRVSVSDDGEIIDVPSKPTPQPTAQAVPAAQPRPAPQPAGNPGDAVVGFGKHQGKTVSAIHAEDPGYVKWLADKAQDATIKLAAQTLLQSQPAEQPKATVPAETVANYQQTTISEAQLKRLYAIAHQYQVPSAIIKDYMRDKHKVGSAKELNRAQYDEVCAWIEGKVQGKAAEQVDLDSIDIGDGIPEDNWAAGLEPPPETFGDEHGQFAFGGEPA
jgi:hypothetical protein